MPELFRYAAFISYSSKDAAFAQRLHRALEGYGIPGALGRFDIIGGGKPNRIYPVFRDREELSAGDLGERIEASLKASAALIVVCSPNAAASPWVQKEIEFFASSCRRDKIFAIIADSAPLADKTGADATAQSFPPAFRGDALADPDALEPLAADARKGKDGFRNAWLKLVAGMIGVTPGRIIDRDRKRRHARRLQLALGAGIVALALGEAAAWIGARDWRSVLSSYPEAVAREQRELGALTFAIAGVGSPGALIGARAERADAILSRAGGVKIRDLGIIERFDLARSGTALAVIGERGGGRLYDLTRSQVRELGRPLDFYLSANGAVLLLRNQDGTAILHDLKSGGAPRPFGAPGVDFSRSHFVVSGEGGVVVDHREDGTGVVYALAKNTVAPLGRLGDSYHTTLYLSDNGASLITSQKSGEIFFYNLAHGGAQRSLGVFERDSKVSLSRDGATLVLQSDLEMLLFDLLHGGAPSDVGPIGMRDGYAFAANGAALVTTGEDGGMRYYNLASGGEPKLLGKFGGLAKPYLSRDGARLVMTGQDRGMAYPLVVHDLASGRPPREIGRRAGAFAPIAVSADGTMVVAADDGGGVTLYNLIDETRTQRLGELGQYFTFELSDNGAVLIVRGQDLSATFYVLSRLGQTGSVGELGRNAKIEMSEDSAVLIDLRQDGAGILYELGAPSPALDSSGRALNGAKLAASVCAASGSAVWPFEPAERDSSRAAIEDRLGRSDARRVHAILLGRPWNPCDWRGVGG